VQARMADDPVSVLEPALALVELYESNQPDVADVVLADMPFIGTCFQSKRCNGWIAVVGGRDAAEVEAAVTGRWQFRFFSGPPRPTGVYGLLNMLARYAFVYGRIRFGDGHALAHFVEDFCPGLLICREPAGDLQLTLSLAAMKMGVPAVVPTGYPFPLGRTIRADALEDVAEAVVGFENVRRLLRTPEIPGLPDYCDPENQKQKIEPAAVWGGTEESFYIVRKGRVESPGWEVVGEPGAAGTAGTASAKVSDTEKVSDTQAAGAPAFRRRAGGVSDTFSVSDTAAPAVPAAPIGIAVTIDAEPMDAIDRRHIEGRIIHAVSMMAGVQAQYGGEGIRILLAAGAQLDPNRIGEVLLAATRQEFPRLRQVRVEVIFDPARLAESSHPVRREKLDRQREIDAATEQSARTFCLCVGCSPFAPDHVCVLTPQRPPQCNRPFGQIKTGALYGYDDMTNIHHSRLHRQVNSFQVADKGRCLDPVRGEWEGIDRAVERLSAGRTRRVQLHCLDEFPTTGCGCFRMVMFKTHLPRPGIGIMAAGYPGRSPDGRSWPDLHYSLAGKQTPGVAGGAFAYLRSPKFLQAHGGWDAIVWVSPKIAEFMGADLPRHVEVGPDTFADK
jgi:hypothetical protein